MPANRKESGVGKSVPLEEVLNGLPVARRARIKKETGKLATDYLLRKSREALSMTEAEMSALLEEWEVATPDRENGSDLRVATLKRYIEALGGKLRLEADFPERSGIDLDAPAVTDSGKRVAVNA